MWFCCFRASRGKWHRYGLENGFNCFQASCTLSLPSARLCTSHSPQGDERRFGDQWTVRKESFLLLISEKQFFFVASWIIHLLRCRREIELWESWAVPSRTVAAVEVEGISRYKLHDKRQNLMKILCDEYLNGMTSDVSSQKRANINKREYWTEHRKMCTYMLKVNGNKK